MSSERWESYPMHVVGYIADEPPIGAREDMVEYASWLSFPASDPPAWPRQTAAPSGGHAAD